MHSILRSSSRSGQVRMGPVEVKPSKPPEIDRSRCKIFPVPIHPLNQPVRVGFDGRDSGVAPLLDGRPEQDRLELISCEVRSLSSEPARSRVAVAAWMGC